MTAVVNDIELRVYECGFCQSLNFDDHPPKFSSPNEFDQNTKGKDLGIFLI